MDIMELKLTQEIVSIDQSPLFLVFLDLRKAYDTCSGTPPISIKSGRTYTPSHDTLQTLAEGGIPQGAVEDPLA